MSADLTTLVRANVAADYPPAADWDEITIPMLAEVGRILGVCPTCWF